MKQLKLSLIALLTLALVSASFAQKPEDRGDGKKGKRGKHHGRPMMGKLRDRILGKLDKDGDGKISDEERAAGKAELLKKFDKDGDGKLSEEERRSAILGRIAEMIKKYDKDGDGKLDAQEFMAMHKDRMSNRGDGKGRLGKGGMREKILEKFDKDGDGKLSEEERAAARTAIRKHHGKGRPEKADQAAE